MTHRTLLPFALALLCAAAQANVVDDFSVGTSDSGTGSYDHTDYDAGLLGGSRKTKLDTYGGTLSAPWSSTFSGGMLDFLRGSANDGASFFFEYSSGGNDVHPLTLGAGANALDLTFEAGTDTASLELQFFTWDGAGYSNFRQATVSNVAVNGAGVVSVSLAGLLNGDNTAFDPTGFSGLKIYSTPSVGSVGHVVWDKIEAVPEPSTVAAMAVGALALLRRRRR